MIFRQNCLYIYTDGSSLPKPRRGGMGIRFIYLDENEKEHRIDFEPDGHQSATNNQMELKAVVIALTESIKLSIPIEYNRIEIRTDSRYVVDHANTALYHWSRNRWLNRDNKPVENAEIWKELIRVRRRINCSLEIKWVKGHAKDPDNKVVDELAKKSAKSFLKAPITNVKLRRKKTKQQTQRGSIRMKGQRVSIHIINDEFMKLQRLSKYRYEVISKGSEFYDMVDIIFSELHHLKAGHSYFVIFNLDDKNPRILKCIRELKKK